ncbi:hypothetical protein ELY21_05730 [Legionella sp. km535]|uniref:hypothetical protein n=1 Tax=Legionella sp. km535 TaxID=2498107 RepID=UPI000F8DBF74|nr:hypothetical protein [Legionella sp. km535]RUR19024.1 hypothetical protein ELY21_05730 [Legionella sp. km535]
MPDNNSITSSSSYSSIDFSQDIELAEYQPESEQSSVLSGIRQLGVEGTRRFVMPVGAGFLSANAMFELFVTVLQGYPNLVPQMKKILAEYQIPAVAATYATLGALDAVGVSEVKETNRVALSIMEGLGATTFSLPMTMEILTRFIQLIEGQPRNSDVFIPNWSAVIIITFCGMLGVIQSMQSDCLKTNAADPDSEQSTINEIVTHPFMLTASAIMKTAASIHGVTVAFMDLAQVDTQADLEYYLRWGITLAAGAIGGYVLGRPNPEERYDAIILNRTLTVAQLFTLCLAFAGTFYLSPDAEKTYGDVVEEQTLLWTAMIPVLVTMINLFQYLWVVSPSLINKFENVFNQYLEPVLTEPEQNENQELALYSEHSINYGTGAYEHDYSSSDSQSSSYSLGFDLNSSSDLTSSADDASSESDEYSSDDVSSELSEEEQSDSDTPSEPVQEARNSGEAISYARLIGRTSPILRAVPPATKSEDPTNSDVVESDLRIKN